MLNNLFVPIEIASKLIALGFDDPCLAYYDSDKDTIIVSPQTLGLNMIQGLIPKFQKKEIICLPIWQQAFDFIEDKFGYLGNVDYDSKSYFWIVSNKNIVLDGDGIDRTVDGAFNTRLDAKLDCINYMLKLIGDE